RAVSKKLKAQAADSLPAPDFAVVEVSDVPLKPISSARGNQFYIYSSMVPPVYYSSHCLPFITGIFSN
ncbi:MAG: hypothetical protein ACI4P4_12855, partial [Faecousia sp.]